jgi:hypothetical protein
MPDAPYRTIPLRARDGSIRAEAIIDEADYASVSQSTWALSGKYAVRKGRLAGAPVAVLMHRQILGLTAGDGLTGDHINGDPLDNRRANLRVATYGENQQNRQYGYGTSRHRGVSMSRRSGRWLAHGKIHGKMYNLGLYADEAEAARVAAAWRAEHMPFSAH